MNVCVAVAMQIYDFLYHVVFAAVEFYLYPTVSTALVHSVKPKLTE